MEEERLDLIKKMLKKSPKDTFLNYAAALEYEKQGDKSTAIELIERVLDIDEKYLGAYYKLGKLYEEQALPEKAINIYRKGKEIAKSTNDQKTIGELTEALMFLDEDEENW